MTGLFTSVSLDYIRLLLGEPHQQKSYPSTDIWNEGDFQISGERYHKTTVAMFNKHPVAYRFYCQLFIQFFNTRRSSKRIEMAISLLGDQCEEMFHISGVRTPRPTNHYTWLYLATE